MGWQEAAESAGECVRRITAALLCPNLEVSSSGAAPGESNAPAEAGARLGPEAPIDNGSPGEPEAREGGAAAQRLAVAQDVASAWALPALDGAAEGAREGSGGCPDIW